MNAHASKPKKSSAWPLILWSATFVAALASGLYIHSRSIRAFEDLLARSLKISRKQELAQGMTSQLERYRRISSSFRRIGPEKEAEAKDLLESRADEFSKRLESLDPTPDDRARDESARHKLREFLSRSLKLEPMLFTRDVFQKEEMRDLYESIGTEWEAIAESARAESQTLQGSLTPASALSFRTIAIAMGAACLLVLGLLIYQYFKLRPARVIGSRALAWTDWAQNEAASSAPEALKRTLPPAFAEAESALSRLATTVRAQRRERLEFITAIATDLRSPLTRLQSALEVISQDSKGDLPSDPSSLQLKAASLSAARGAAFRLSKTLDDLTDLIDLPSASIRLNERIVDLRALISGLTETMQGPLSQHTITVNAPALPVWTHLDSERIERVLLHLYSKLMNLLPQGGAIEAQLLTKPESGFRGVEIVLSERRSTGGLRGSAGPAQDLLKHWVADTGFGMKLAQKILHAHGGAIFAAGVAGTGVSFVVRIPAERVALGLMHPELGGLGEQMNSPHALDAWAEPGLPYAGSKESAKVAPSMLSLRTV